jgi:hypothetical protein
MLGTRCCFHAADSGDRYVTNIVIAAGIRPAQNIARHPAGRIKRPPLPPINISGYRQRSNRKQTSQRFALSIGDAPTPKSAHTNLVRQPKVKTSGIHPALGFVTEKYAATAISGFAAPSGAVI